MTTPLITNVQQTVHLSVDRLAPKAAMYAVQNDTGRKVEMIIDDYILNAGAAGKITFERSDKTHYEAPAELNLANNSFIAEVDQALTQFGETKVQLKVDNDNGRVSTFAFLIYVEKDTTGMATEQEAMDIGEAISKAEEAISTAETVLSTAEEAVTRADSAVSKAEDAIKHFPYIDEETHNWIVWDAENEVWVDTGISAGGISTETKFWFGTRAEYNALEYYDPEVCYCIEEGT